MSILLNSEQNPKPETQEEPGCVQEYPAVKSRGGTRTQGHCPARPVLPLTGLESKAAILLPGEELFGKGVCSGATLEVRIWLVQAAGKRPALKADTQ